METVEHLKACIQGRDEIIDVQKRELWAYRISLISIIVLGVIYALIK